MTSDQNLTSDPDESPSSLPNIAVRACGFDDDIAQMLGQGMLSVVREVGRSIDLSKLDGITIAMDEDAALRKLTTYLHQFYGDLRLVFALHSFQNRL